MALCVNQSGTWREITTNCVNVSGTWRNIETGCINQSGTWRCYGFYDLGNCPLGSNVEGGYLIKKSSGLAWIVAPSSTEVSRDWYCRDDATTTAQSVSGCTGWFVPTRGQLQNPGFTCRTYWDSYAPAFYWSSTENPPAGSGCPWRDADAVPSVNGNIGCYSSVCKGATFCVRSFRCVSY